MNIFLDTADSDAIRELMPTGIVSGVTTNPTTLSRAGANPLRTVQDICALMPNHPVSVEITYHHPEDVYEQAKKIAAIAPNVVVKIPCILLYYPVIKQLVRDNVALNITLVFSAAQAAMMSIMDVAYISPFIGRLEDSGGDAMTLLHTICTFKKNNNYATKVLAASIRTVEHFDLAISAGADCVTLSPVLFKAASTHVLSSKGVEKFNADWALLPPSDFP